MSEGSENLFGQVPNKSWLRKGRKADFSDVPVKKIQEAAEKRGIRLDNAESSPEGSKVEVSKVVVNGDDK